MVELNSILGGAGAGALAGGAVGSIVPGIGTLAGGAIGAGVGGLGGVVGDVLSSPSKKDIATGGGGTTIQPYGFYAPSTSNQTSSSLTNAWQYNPIVSYQISSPGAVASPTTTKKDAITQETGQAATPTSNLTAPLTQGLGAGTDLTGIALIAGAALVLYGFVKK